MGTGNLQRVDAEEEASEEGASEGGASSTTASSGPAAPSGLKLHPEFVAVGGQWRRRVAAEADAEGFPRLEAYELPPRTSASSAALASLVDFLTQQGHFGQDLVVAVAPPGVGGLLPPPAPLPMALMLRSWSGPLLLDDLTED